MLSSLFYIQGDEACLPFELFLPDLFLPKQPFLIIKQKKQNSQLFLKPLSACDKAQVQNPTEAGPGRSKGRRTPKRTQRRQNTGARGLAHFMESARMRKSGACIWEAKVYAGGLRWIPDQGTRSRMPQLTKEKKKILQLKTLSVAINTWCSQRNK